MRVLYDIETDTLLITLRDTPIDESDEVAPDVIADFAEDGTVVRFEILGASRYVTDPRHVSLDIRVPEPAVR
jgi:uncharacterized protein YuzE